MSDINKFTSKEVLNKVLLDSSGNSVAAFSHTTQEALNAALDTTNNRLNMSLAGGTISGDVTINGDLTVNGDGSGTYDEIINGNLEIVQGDAKAELTLLSSSNTHYPRIHLKKADLSDNLVDDDDLIGNITWHGYDGDQYLEMAMISAVINGTAANNQMPGSLEFKVNAGGSGINSDPSMIITSAGKVGIGTGANVDSQLHVQDDSSNCTVKIEASASGTGARLQMISATNDTAEFYLGDADDTNIGRISYNHTSNYLAIHTNDTERMRIQADGQVAIGQTSSDGAKVHIKGSEDVALTAESTDSGTYISFMDNSSTNWYNARLGAVADALVFQTAATTRMTIDSAGNVGIGATPVAMHADNSLLQVGSTATIFAQTASGTGKSLYIGQNVFRHTDGTWDTIVEDAQTLYEQNDGNHYFYTGASHASVSTLVTNMKIDANSKISLSNNDSGTDNTVFGFLSGASIASGGIQNVFIGDYAGNATTTGDYNVAIGKGAMLDNVDGSFNTAVGRLALENFEPSSGGDGHNTAMGATAGNDISTGLHNTCIGSNSGHDGTNNLTTGSQNTFLGAYTNGSGYGTANSTVIGYNADGTGDNEIALGNTSISAIKAQVTSITAYSSDERTKKDVADYDLKGVDFIKELQLKTYLYKNPVDFPDEIRHSKWDAKDEDGNLIHERPSDPTETQVGFIAQEVEAALAKHGVGNTETYAPTQDSGIKTLTYGNLIFPLIKAVQELTARIEELEK